METFLHIVEHSFWDSLKLFPFLLITYWILEYLEHKAGDKATEIIKKSGKYGPLVGALAGLFPQCGFSAAASNFYAARVVTLGTLIAVFLSTSDEMLPVMIAGGVAPSIILKILAIKVLIGMVAGLIIDICMRNHNGKKSEQIDVHTLCEHEGCHCHERGILKSAVYHSLQITLFIFIITFVLSYLIHFIGHARLNDVFFNKPVVGEMVAGLVGLIPNCSASVVITQLYIDNAINLGTMMSGVLVGSGVGLLVLFKVNKNLYQNLKIVGLLYFIGVISGVIINLLNVSL